MPTSPGSSIWAQCARHLSVPIVYAKLMNQSKYIRSKYRTASETLWTAAKREQRKTSRRPPSINRERDGNGRGDILDP